MLLKRIIVVVSIMFWLGTGTSIAQTNVYKLHALFIYNFTKHIQWTNVGDAFTIGVFGSETALKEIKTNFADKKFSGKEFRVISIAGVGDANACQLVYTPKSSKAKILSLFESANKHNILFVSEDDMIADGLPVSFILKSEKLSFKISKKSLDASGLKVSSSLLSLGEVVD